MKVLAVSFLIALAVTIAGCGETGEPVADTESEVSTEAVDIKEEVEIVEETVVTGQLPDPWPADLLLPEGMIVVREAGNQDGYPLLVTQYADGTEPLALGDVYDYYCDQATNTDWTIPLPEQNDSTLTSTSFHLDLMHPEYMLIQLDGSSDAETGILTVELVWLN